MSHHISLPRSKKSREALTRFYKRGKYFMSFLKDGIEFLDIMTEDDQDDYCVRTAVALGFAAEMLRAKKNSFGAAINNRLEMRIRVLFLRKNHEELKAFMIQLVHIRRTLLGELVLRKKYGCFSNDVSVEMLQTFYTRALAGLKKVMRKHGEYTFDGFTIEVLMDMSYLNTEYVFEYGLLGAINNDELYGFMTTTMSSVLTTSDAVLARMRWNVEPEAAR